MKNNYNITDYSGFGLPSIEVVGVQFHYQDLYEMVGVNRFMTTFELRKGSASYIEYGNSVLGVIYYDRKGLDSLERAIREGLELAKKRVRIDSPCRELSEGKKGDLKYRGITIEDIESISFLPHIKETESHETGEKKVPNIIELEVDCSEIDPDILNQNYLVSKHNFGTKLTKYEKEQLIGITLAFNNGSIDSRVLTQFNFTEEDLKTNLNIWLSLYKVKDRRNQLTEVDVNNYAEVKARLSLERFNRVSKELISTGIPRSLEGADSSILKSILSAVEYFSPSILMHGKNQVYWDVDSYIHIALRHLKEYQLGHFQIKTSLPYKAEALKSLIEKVLQRINTEIESYLSEDPKGEFVRKGRMAIEYNGDYYHLRINQYGRLVQFHSVDSEFNKTIHPTANAAND
jgi:hypothetical protein